MDAVEVWNILSIVIVALFPFWMWWEYNRLKGEKDR
jgi:hypothetical protein